MNACKLNKGFGDKSRGQSARNLSGKVLSVAKTGFKARSKPPSLVGVAIMSLLYVSPSWRCGRRVASSSSYPRRHMVPSCPCITGALLLGPTSMVLPCELMCFSRLRYQEETGGGGPTPPHGLRDVAVEPIKTRGLSPRRAWVDERRMIMSKWH